MFDVTMLTDLGIRFAINTAAMILLVFGLFYRRHRDKMLATTASMFNISAFGVLATLSSVEFSLAAGFGLFAILALFSLRSEQIGRIEIAYFFGSVAIAVICSVQGTSLEFVVFITALVVLGAYFSDHPALLRSSHMVKVTLDQIDAKALSHPEDMRAHLSTRLGVEVMAYQIEGLNYVNDLAVVSVYYRKG